MLCTVSFLLMVAKLEILCLLKPINSHNTRICKVIVQSDLAGFGKFMWINKRLKVSRLIKPTKI